MEEFIFRYWAVMFWKDSSFGLRLTDVCFGGLNSAVGLKLAVLDKDTMLCSWRDYALDGMPGVHGLTGRFMDIKSFDGFGVEFVQQTEKKYFLRLFGCVYYFILEDTTLVLRCPFGKKVTVLYSGLLKNASRIRIALVCNSGDDIYRVMLYLQGPHINALYNVWVDAGAGLPIGTAWGIDIKSGLLPLEGMPQDKLDGLRSRMAKMLLFPCCGRVY